MHVLFHCFPPLFRSVQPSCPKYFIQKLEQIVWPHVRTKIEQSIHDITLQHHQQQQQHNQLLPPVKGTITEDSNDQQNDKNIIIVEAALLLETEWHDLLDGLWVIHSSEDVATSRLINNRGMTKEDALIRIRAQQKRKGIAIVAAANGGGVVDGDEVELHKAIGNRSITALISNNGSLDDLEKALKETLADPLSFKTGTKEKHTE